MKTATIAILLVLGLGLCGCRGKKVDKSKLVKRGQFAYEVNSEKPFTGKMIEHFVDGQAEGEVEFRDGEPHGESTVWYLNRQKAAEGQYRHGKMEGEWTFWYDTGHKREEGEYRDGKKHGKWLSWDEEGGKQAEREYENGKMVKEKLFNYDKMRGIFWE